MYIHKGKANASMGEGLPDQWSKKALATQILCTNTQMYTER